MLRQGVRVASKGVRGRFAGTVGGRTKIARVAQKTKAMPRSNQTGLLQRGAMLSFPFAEHWATANPETFHVTDLSRGHRRGSNDQRVAEAHYHLRKELPQILRAPHNMDLYSDNVIFEDHISGSLSTRGKLSYSVLLSVFRQSTWIYISDPRLEIIWLKPCYEESTVECRWRLVGKQRIGLNIRELSTLPNGHVSLDAHSTFDVDRDGKICKHTVEQVISTRDYSEGISGYGSIAWMS